MMDPDILMWGIGQLKKLLLQKIVFIINAVMA